MRFAPSNSQHKSKILKDGEYYVFAKAEAEKISLGYIYTTWAGSPCGTVMRFSVVEIGKPLSLSQTEGSQQDQGQLKLLSIDHRNPDLVDEVYTSANNFLTKMRDELKYPQLDETTDCLPMIMVVEEGKLVALYSKEGFLNSFS